jgi:hypothetical protein
LCSGEAAVNYVAILLCGDRALGEHFLRASLDNLDRHKADIGFLGEDAEPRN